MAMAMSRLWEPPFKFQRPSSRSQAAREVLLVQDLGSKIESFFRCKAAQHLVSRNREEQPKFRVDKLWELQRCR
jgi:hypothetical protein